MALNEYDEIVKGLSNEKAPSMGDLSEYDSILKEQEEDKKIMVRGSMYGALDKNPDEMAKNLKLAERTKLPLGTVERNYKDVYKSDVLETTDYDRLIKETPSLASMLEDQNNSAVMHDDIDNLGQVEVGVSKLNKFKFDTPDVIKDFSQAGKIGFQSMTSNMMATAVMYGVGMGEGGYTQDEMLQMIADSEKKEQELRSQQPDYLKQFNEALEKETGDVAKANARFMQSFDKFKQDKIKEGLQDFIIGGATSVGEFLDRMSMYPRNPKALSLILTEQAAQSSVIGLSSIAGAQTGAAIAGAATANPAVAMGGAVVGGVIGAFPAAYATEAGAQLKESIRKRGYDTSNVEDLKRAFADKALIDEIKGEAQRKGLGTAAVDSLFSAFAGKWLPKASGFKNIVKAAGKEVVVQQLGEGASELTGLTAMERGDLTKVNYMDVFDEMILSLGTNVKEVTGQSIAKYRIDKKYNTERTKYHPDPVVAAEEITTDTNKASSAVNQAMILTEVGKHAAESKTIERLPEKLSELISMTDEEGAPSSVYYQADDWDNYWNGKGLSPLAAYEKIMGNVAGYHEAKETGGQLELPLSKYIPATAKTEHYESLVALARLSQNGMNLIEAKEHFKTLPILVEGVAAESIEQGRVMGTEDIEASQDYKDEYTRQYNQLKASGRSTKEAEYGAGLAARNVAIRSSIRNQKSGEFARDVEITGYDTAQPVATESKVFEQAPVNVKTEAEKLSTESGQAFIEYNKANNALTGAKNVLKKRLLEALGGDVAETERFMENLSSGFTRMMMQKDIDEIQDRLRTIGKPALDFEEYISAVERKVQANAVAMKARSKYNDYVEGNKTYFQEMPKEQQFINIVKDGNIEVRSNYGTIEASPVAGDSYSHLESKIKADNVIEVNSLEVRSDSRGSGNGTKLLNELEKIAARNGYDGVILRGFPLNVDNPSKEEINRVERFYKKNGYKKIGKDNLDPQQSVFFKKIDKTLFQTEQAKQVVPAFYSKLIKTVEEKMGGSASVEQINGMLKEIKPEERKWMQLDEFLKGKTKVSKEELLTFLNANQLQIEEKTLGSEVSFLTRDDLQEREDLPDYVDGLTREWSLTVPENLKDYIEYVDISEYENGKSYEVNFNGNVIGSYGTLGKALQGIENKISEDHGIRFGAVESEKGSAQYSDYKLSGGDNYREVLFKMTASEQQKVKVETPNRTEEFDSLAEAEKYFQGLPSDVAKLSRIYEGEETGFVSGHFQKEPNILAFTRLDDRVDSDGKKVLFIEEIQSDWHQEGRKKGYQGDSVKYDKLPVDYKVVKISDEKYNVLDGSGKKVGAGFNEEDAINSTINRLNDEARGSTATPVPDAPLKKTWHEFVLKRLIREAAEKGYDKIAWTTGEQQAERYDLSKQIDSVTYFKTDNGKYSLTVTDLDGNDIAKNTNYTLDEIESFLGKDIAKRIEEDKGSKIKGKKAKVLKDVDLSVGGEGMKGFYDQMIPSFLNKFGKKYGASVSETKIKSDKETLTVHSIEITPALKEAALNEGFTLFQKDKEARGQIRFGKNKINIDLFKNANESTYLHETGHAFLENMKDDVLHLKSLDPNSLTDIQKDFLTRGDDVLKWLGIDSWDSLEREHHEKWARGFEAYLMEGKAPTAGLRAAFSAFKVWLINIYRQLTNLNVELSDDIRNVMDRLIATDEEIAREQGILEMTPLFGDPKFQGMTETQVKKYLKAQEEAQDFAKEQVNNKLMKDYKRTKEAWYKEKRAAVEADIEKTLNETKVYKSLSILQKGTMPDGSKLPEGVYSIKLDKASVVKSYDKNFVKKMPRGVTAKEGGVHQDVAAGLLGYATGDDLVVDITNAPKKDLLLKQMTDAKMQELYPDMLLTNELPEEAIKSLHNEKRAEMLQMELEHLASNNMPVLKEGIRRLAKRPPTNKQVKAQALSILSKKDVKDIKPIVFQRAEQKARKDAGILFAKGDIEGAFDSKVKELLNFEMYRIAVEAEDLMEKDQELFKKMFKKDEDLAKSRDMDLVNAARAILAQYGIGKMDKSPMEYLAPIEKYDPETYAYISELVAETIRPIVNNLAMKDNYKSVSYNDYVRFSDTMKAIWSLAKTVRETEVDGKKMDLKQMAEELTVQAMEVNGSGMKEYKTTATKWDQGVKQIMGALSSLRRVEHWADAMDSGAKTGIYKKYIYNLVAKSTADYRIAKNEYIKKYLEIIKKLEPSLRNTEPIYAPELGQYVKFNSKADLVGAILHTGNESNLSKLLRGRKWGEYRDDGSLDTSKWDAFINRMHKEGVLTKADYDYAQAVWDLMEELKPALQKAHKKMRGHYFSEITADPFTTPYGTYRGGYVPAKADPFFASDAQVREMKELLESNNNSFAFPTAGSGATKKRVENYAAPLNLNLNMIPSHIDWALRFTHIEPKVRDTAKLLMDKKLVSALNDIDPTIVGDMLNPWLQRAATQQVTFASEGTGGKFLDHVVKTLRRRVGMNAMFANVTNTIQQITGFSLSALKVGQKHLREAAWKYLKSPKESASVIQEKSKFMKTRADTSINEMQEAINDITLNPSKYDKLKDFAAKHAYFMQSSAQNFVDNITWMASYNESIVNGMSEQEAVDAADSTVRLTQGSQSPEDISKFESGTPFQRLFTMFYSYFNMQANLLGTEFTNTIREGGLKKNAGKLLYIYTFGFLIPAAMSELLVQLMSGKGLDEDDDDQYMDDFMLLFFGSQFNTATAMIPLAGTVLKPVIGGFTSKPYDDKISSSPAITAIEGGLVFPAEFYKDLSEGNGIKKKTIKDGLTAIALFTGVPVGALGKPIGYQMDVLEGNAEPDNAIDYTRGLITGKSGK